MSSFQRSPVSENIIWAPTPKQEEFLSASETELLYGGAAGGGKTDALIIDALGLWQDALSVPRYRALLLRTTFPQLREVIDRTRAIYPRIVPGAFYHTGDKEWRFPSGAKVIFGYLERDSDCDNYQGQEYQYIGFEELTQWGSSYCFDYLRSRLRGTDLKKLMRATCNPGGIGSKWVQDYWRISDDGSPSKFKLAYDVDGELVEISRRFIPARVTDNPHLPAAYRANLMAQSDVVRKALLEGRWDVQDIPGAIYKSELEAARSEGRVTKVPYDPSVPVYVSWDLGIGDATAIWCAQIVGREIHLIDYYEASGEPLTHYCEWLDKRGYRYAEDLFPHDARARELGTGKSREELARANGRKVRIVPRLAIEDGINAVRQAFPRLWVDAERCKRGIECLQNYRREYNDKMGEFKAQPVHDRWSHGSDSARYLCVGLRDMNTKVPVVKLKPKFNSAPNSWMG